MNVARLVPVPIEAVRDFEHHFVSVVNRIPSLSLQDLKDLLRDCNDFLRTSEPDILIDNDESQENTFNGEAGYAYIASRDSARSEKMFAVRAIAVVLDIAIISFCGAH
jgi:hypothetical protein